MKKGEKKEKISSSIFLETTSTKKNTKKISVLNNANESIDIEVKTFISLSDRCEFVKNVVETVFYDIDGESSRYTPEWYDFAINYNLIQFFTNIELPKQSEKIYELIKSTNIIQKIIHEIDENEYSQLIRSVDEAIDFEKKCNIQYYGTAKFINSIMSVVSDLKNINAEDVLKNVDVSTIIQDVQDKNNK